MACRLSPPRAHPASPAALQPLDHYSPATMEGYCMFTRLLRAYVIEAGRRVAACAGVRRSVAAIRAHTETYPPPQPHALRAPTNFCVFLLSSGRVLSRQCQIGRPRRGRPRKAETRKRPANDLRGAIKCLANQSLQHPCSLASRRCSASGTVRTAELPSEPAPTAAPTAGLYQWRPLPSPS